MTPDARAALDNAAIALENVLREQTLDDMRSASVTANYDTGTLEIDMRVLGIPAQRRAGSEVMGASGRVDTPWAGLEPLRCVARNRKGERCRHRAIAGGTVCHNHGGAASQVKAAAARRLETQTALQWAKRELERTGVEGRTPLEHLESSLEEAARTYAVWELCCETLVQEQRSGLMGRDRHGQLAIHPYVSEKDAALDRWARISKYALDAGVAERRVKILQEQGELMASALRAVVGRLELSATAERQALAWLGEELQKQQRGRTPAQLPAST